MSQFTLYSIEAIFHWIDGSSTRRVLGNIESKTAMKEVPSTDPWNKRYEPGATTIRFMFADFPDYEVDSTKVPPIDYSAFDAEVGAPVHIVVYDYERNVIRPRRPSDEKS